MNYQIRIGWMTFIIVVQPKHLIIHVANCKTSLPYLSHSITTHVIELV